MENHMSEEVTRIIPIQGRPKEKVFLYGEASGVISVKCPNCSGFVLIDLDNMDAHHVRATQGASSRWRQKNE